MFKLARTFTAPAQGSNSQRGFPMPGAGAQTIGQPGQAPEIVPRVPERPTQGIRSWLFPEAGGNAQRGQPMAQNDLQRRPAGSMPGYVAPDGLNHPVTTPYFSRGAAATVQNYGKVTTNPIGAGVVALYRPQASYGPAAQYANGQIFWTPQAINTSLGSQQGLQTPEQMLALLGEQYVQAAVRVDQ